MIAIYATAYLALASWALANWGRCLEIPRWARLLWSLGCLANLGHLLLAFHIVHGWHPNAAAIAIAQQTYAQVGVAWSGGIYVNYAFCLLWLLDAATWWIAPKRYESRSRWLDAVIQFTFLFLFVNATLVFGNSPFRFVGGLMCLAGAVGWLLHFRRVRMSWATYFFGLYVGSSEKAHDR